MPAPLAKGKSSTASSFVVPPLGNRFRDSHYAHLYRQRPSCLALFHSTLSSSNLFPHLGLILSFSILFAASLAIYENNPEIRNWVDNSRRRIAIALHDLGDEFAPRPQARRTRSPDASVQEDESPEAAERRRRARAEIMERGRVLEEKRREKRGSAKSFDDLVDKDGVLKNHEPGARATATDLQSGASEMRKRNIEVQGAAMGATLANPFADEIPMEFFPAEEHNASAAHSRSSTPTLGSPAQHILTPETPRTLLADTDEISNHPSEQLVDLTPTTSASVPTSPHQEDLASLSSSDDDEAPPPAPWTMSIDEWAENANASFYSAPQSQSTHSDPPAAAAAGHEEQESEKGADTPTISESGEHVSQIGSDDMDVLSDFGGISTPGTWTEVGSVSSEDY